MGFTAEIEVTGICGIVPRDNDHPGDPGAWCVVVPNAWMPDPRATKPSLDKFCELRRHAAFVTFTTQPKDKKTNRQDLEGLWHLSGQRLRVNARFDGATPAAKWGPLGGLARWTDIVDAGSRSLLSVERVVKQPDPKSVAAQLVLHTGTLEAKPGNLKWIFDPYLRSPTPLPDRSLSHKATFTLDGLKSLEIEETTFKGKATGRRHVFTSGPAYVKLANLCDQNPLQWGKAPEPQDLPDDDDFRWHFELVDNPGDLHKALKGFRCPIPRIKAPLTKGAGNGLNCDPKLFPNVSFTF